MNRGTIIGWLISTALLIGVAVLCFVRWNAWFGMPEEPLWVGDTIQYKFHCFGDDSIPGFEATEAGWQDTEQPDMLRLCILGDVHNNIECFLFDSIAARHAHIDAYAQVGDFVERCYFYWWQALYAELAPSAFAHLPILPTPGNHEYTKAVIKTLPDEWKYIFNNPQNGPADFIGTSYYVDFPTLRLIAIDTDGIFDLKGLLRTQTWLKGAIKSAGDRFIVVIMHHPVISTGSGRQNWLFRAAFKHVLNRADLVFAGHDHNYARRLPYVDTNSAEKFYLSSLNRKDTRVASGFQMYEIVTIKNDTLTMQTYMMESGQLYDEVLIIRHPDGTKQVIDNAATWAERIELPEKYQNRQHEIKVRRFLNKRRNREANRIAP